MLINLNIDLLRAFVTVVDACSFTKAAEILFRTQSTISLQIKKLESYCGAVLLERESRNIRMTEEGQKLYSYATKILELHDEMRSHIGEPSSAQRVLRIGIPDDFAQTFLSGFFEAIRQWCPDVEVFVTSDTSNKLREMVDQGELDLAIVTSENPLDGGKVLRQEKLRWVRGTNGQVEDGSPLPMAVFNDGCIFRRRAIEALTSRERPWTIVHSGNSFSGLLAVLKSGNAVSVLAESSVDRDLVLLVGNDYPDLGDVTIRLIQGARTKWLKIQVLNQMIETIMNRSFDHVSFLR